MFKLLVNWALGDADLACGCGEMCEFEVSDPFGVLWVSVKGLSRDKSLRLLGLSP